MQKLIVFCTFMALSASAPGILLTHEVHLPLGKTTVTKSSQIVDHGSTYAHHPIAPLIHETPVIHTPVVHFSVPHKTTVSKSSQIVNHGSLHVPYVHEVHVPVLEMQKTTVTKSSQSVDHGSSTVFHGAVVHAAPLLVHSSPLVTFKTGDSAVSHHSSTVHETLYH